MQHKSSVVKVGRELSEAAKRVHNLFIFFTRQIADCVADCLVLLSNQGWIRVKCCSLKLMRRLISVMFFFYLYTLCFGTITGFILQYWSSNVKKKLHLTVARRVVSDQTFKAALIEYIDFTNGELNMLIHFWVHVQTPFTSTIYQYNGTYTSPNSLGLFGAGFPKLQSLKRHHKL